METFLWINLWTFNEGDPDGIVGQPHGARTTAYLEVGAFIKLAHVLNEHDWTAAEGFGHVGAVEGGCSCGLRLRLGH